MRGFVDEKDRECAAGGLCPNNFWHLCDRYQKTKAALAAAYARCSRAHRRAKVMLDEEAAYKEDRRMEARASLIGDRHSAAERDLGRAVLKLTGAEIPPHDDSPPVMVRVGETFLIVVWDDGCKPCFRVRTVAAADVLTLALPDGAPEVVKL